MFQLIYKFANFCTIMLSSGQLIYYTRACVSRKGALNAKIVRPLISKIESDDGKINQQHRFMGTQAKSVQFFNNKIDHRNDASRKKIQQRHQGKNIGAKNTLSLVIFDKDGTLICFDSMWTPWAREIAVNMKRKSRISTIEDDVHKLLGFCPKSNTVKPGLLAEGTTGQIKAELVGLLVKHGMPAAEAQHVVSSAWCDCDTSKPGSLKALGDVKTLFETLKRNDIKIAICTSDTRKGTLAALDELGLRNYVDMIVCGDDVNNIPKPHPHNALRICKTLNVEPHEACMVGDTVVDVQMGKSARLGSSVGVLSGVGRVEDLCDKSDILLNEVGDLIPFILNDQNSSSSSPPDPPKNAEMIGGLTNRVSTAAVQLSSSTAGPSSSSSSLFGRFRRYFSDTGNTSIRRYSSRAALSRPRNDFDNDSLNVIYRRRLKTKNLINIQHRRLASPFSLGAAKLPDIDANFHFTHVIIGAGSAGCVMANRLTENPKHKVLLIEAGPRDDWWRWKIHMPSALMYNLSNDNYNWYYHTLPEVHMNERVMYCPRGRVWGGSSALNAMVYVRGHAKDYDRWAFKEGAQGWSYADCLPYFKKSENFDKGADDYRGGSGPLHVHRFDGKHNPLYAAFVEAGKQAGYGFTEDMNGFKQEGVGYMDATIYKGKRWSAAQAYLRPILKRPNFFYECNSLVTKLIFDKHRAVGVETVRNVRNAEPSRRRHYCESDVILCGGAINSPQILMLSGIGHEAVLKAADVPVRLHLPGVGQNLQDHLELYVQQRCSQPVTLYDKSTLRYPHKMAAIGLQWLFTRQGLGATGHLEAGGFVRSETEDEHPNIQFHFLPSMVVDHGRKDPSFHGFQVHVGPMRPTSRGFVKITTKNPFDHPAIVFNYMSTDFDRLEMRQSIKAARKIFQQKAFDEYRAGEVQPGVDLENDSDLDDFVRENADSAYHPSCTCKMGPVSDPCSVVDPLTMIVHGTDNLRIVDSSVMPSVVSGNLNAPVMMMAEKAADMIQNKPLLAKAENIPVFSHKK